MFLIVSNNLTEFDVYNVELFIRNAGLLYFKFLDVNKDSMPEFDVFTKHHIILMYNETKGEPALIHKLKKLYGNDFLKKIHYTTISRPDVFLKNQHSQFQVLETLKPLRAGIRKLEINELPVPVNYLNDIYEHMKVSKIYILKTNQYDLEIRPTELYPTLEQSLTYDEFITLIMSKFLFGTTASNIFQGSISCSPND